MSTNSLPLPEMPLLLSMLNALFGTSHAHDEFYHWCLARAGDSNRRAAQMAEELVAQLPTWEAECNVREVIAFRREVAAFFLEAYLMYPQYARTIVNAITEYCEQHAVLDLVLDVGETRYT